MKTYATTLLVLLLLAALAGAQTPEGTRPRQQAPAAAAQSEQLAEAARLAADVLHLFSQRKYDEAAPLAERVLAIRSEALGPQHRGVAEAEYNLGMVRVGQGRFEDAEALLRRALAVFEKAPEPPAALHAKVLSGLALVRAKLDHAEEASKLSEAAAAVAEKALAPGAEELGDYYRQLADIYRRKRNVSKAEHNYLRAIEVWARTAGREDARVEMAVESLLCTPVALNRGRRSEVWERLTKVLDSADPWSGSVFVGKVISKPPPEYPAEAKGARVSGSVVVKIFVDETGTVRRADAICGHGLLAKASAEAARRALFHPSLVDGKPSKVTGFITYNFVLQ
jgi:TonB family protein